MGKLELLRELRREETGPALQRNFLYVLEDDIVVFFSFGLYIECTFFVRVHYLHFARASSFSPSSKVVLWFRPHDLLSRLTIHLWQRLALYFCFFGFGSVLRGLPSDSNPAHRHNLLDVARNF